ncbi:MAG: hypothetical protein N4A72_05225 [Bacteroidales bacterium]|jgi:hypothetical protein|nr:hypothetical protein [Bacteroidales bacterium]
MHVPGGVKLKGSTLIEVIVAMTILTLFWAIAMTIVVKIDFELNEIRQQRAMYFLTKAVNGNQEITDIPEDWDIVVDKIDDKDGLTLVEFRIKDRRGKVVYRLNRWEKTEDYNRRMEADSFFR